MNKMTPRLWLEFGKMYTRMEKDNLPFGVLCNAEGSTSELNAYEALKDHYFTNYLGIKTTDIEIDLDDETMEKLYELSDERGITVDEFIADILKNYLDSLTEKECPDICDNYGPAECCGQCTHRVDSICLFTGKRVHKTFICNDFSF